jgi:Cdc6-like AAA superfamily ATPase
MINTPKFITSPVFEGFMPENKATRELYEEVEAFARHGKPIMIFGPTGSGKEFLARHYYKTLTESDFYKQWKLDWPEKYKQIYTKYENHYSPGDRDVFINSLSVGTFHSINGATIIPKLAESILFGHEKKVFTDAETTPGLLEVIKCGVLFIDEVGDLPESVQPKLLRAFDSAIRTGRRTGGKMDYSLKDLIIISATNRPRESIREDLYYRIGADVDIMGLDDRPEDFQNFIPIFICNAIGQRTDYEVIKKLFGINNVKRNSDIPNTSEVKRFAATQGKSLAEFVKKRKWPGNLRALNRVFESAIVTTPSVDNLENFTDAFVERFHIYCERGSKDPARETLIIEKEDPKPVYPSKHPRLDKRIFDEITGKNLLPKMNDTEINVLAKFLSSSYESSFKLPDLIDELKKYPAIKHTSEGRIRGCLLKLIEEKIIGIEGQGRGTRYFLTNKLPDHVYSDEADIFALPNFKPSWTSRKDEIEELKSMFSSERIYIEGPTHVGKTAFITMFCHAMQKHYNFYYYRLGTEGLMKLFKEIRSVIRISDSGTKTGDPKINEISNILPHLPKLFKRKGKNKPVLILDDVHYVSDPEDLGAIVNLADQWKDVILILLGGKKDIRFYQSFSTLPLPKWNKEES